MNANLKKILLYAIVPALIAGFFSIAPKLYEIITEPKVELKYTFSKGPEIQVRDQYQRIVSVGVQNTGKKILTEVTVKLSEPEGLVSAFNAQEKNGIKPDSILKDGELSLVITRLHPSEQITFSALITSSTSDSMPSLSVRADETLGEEIPDKTDRKDNYITVVLGAIFAAISVLAMSLFGMTRLAGRVSLAHYKKDILYYIPSRLGIKSISDKMDTLGTDTTYLHLADLFLSEGLLVPPNERLKYAVGLKLLLLVNSVAEISRNAILHNISVLQGSEIKKEELESLNSASLSVNNIMPLRKQIDNFHDKYISSGVSA